MYKTAFEKLVRKLKEKFVDKKALHEYDIKAL
jgi:hypothetical protein